MLYKVHVAYESYGSIYVDVPNDIAKEGEDAIFDYLDNIQDELPLPDDPDYIEGSYEIDREGGLEPYPNEIN